MAVNASKQQIQVPHDRSLTRADCGNIGRATRRGAGLKLQLARRVQSGISNILRTNEYRTLPGDFQEKNGHNPEFMDEPEPEHGHESVMLAETIEALAVRPGAVVVDCTVGRGGHSVAVAAALGPEGKLIGLDADPRNIEYARTRLQTAGCPVHLFNANFSELDLVLREVGIPQVDALLADLGLSTNQFLTPDYGMSFSEQGPLDMRIDPRTRLTASQIVNRFGERELADLLYHLSDERFSRRIARKIVEARKVSPIKSTSDLAELVRSAVPSTGAGRAGTRIDPATRTFMALRMKVNEEVENLSRLLEVAPGHLKPGGRMAVISFHSVEDRAVKQAFRFAEQTGLLKVVTKKPLSPSDLETARNPRARSAKLRVAEKT